MPKTILWILIASLLSAFSVAGLQKAHAATPKVVADIAPVYALIARVMDGLATPTLIIQHGATPHQYSMRPSDASAIEQADLIFTIGDLLSPQLGQAFNSLGKDVPQINLMENDDIIKLFYREGVNFSKDHDHDHHHDDDDHGDGNLNPHAWLDPKNGIIWLDMIAAELSKHDPEHTDIYVQNAAAGKAEISAISEQITKMIGPYRAIRFVVFHDAYQYFENRFDFFAVGAISLGDASSPSPSRILEVSELIRAMNVSCVLAEPQFNQRIINTVIDNTNAKIVTIDPLGSALPLDKSLYVNIFAQILESLSNCK